MHVALRDFARRLATLSARTEATQRLIVTDRKRLLVRAKAASWRYPSRGEFVIESTSGCWSPQTEDYSSLRNVHNSPQFRCATAVEREARWRLASLLWRLRRSTAFLETGRTPNIPAVQMAGHRHLVCITHSVSRRRLRTWPVRRREQDETSSSFR